MDANTAISVELSRGINLDLSTWATRFCTSSTGIALPSLSIHLLTRDNVKDEWLNVAEVKGGTTIDIHSAKHDWPSHVRAQQTFIREQDARTRRVGYLYEEDGTNQASNDQFLHHVYVPAPRPPNLDHSDDDSVGTTTENERSSGDEDVSTTDSEDVKKPSRHASRRPGRPPKLRPLSAGSTSIGDESGSSTSHRSSSHARLGGDTSDPAVSLAHKIRQLQSMRRTILDHDGPVRSLGADASSSLVNTREHADGTIFRVSVLPVSMALKPAAIHHASRLLSAFKSHVSVLAMNVADFRYASQSHSSTGC